MASLASHLAGAAALVRVPHQRIAAPPCVLGRAAQCGTGRRQLSAGVGPVRAAAAAASADAKAPPAAEAEPTDIVLVDHYERLGCSRVATTPEIFSAFAKKTEELLEARRNLSMDEETARQRLLSLEESLEILATEEKRRVYDWRLMREERGSDSGLPEKYVWPYEADITQSLQLPGQSREMVPEDDEGIQNSAIFSWGGSFCPSS